MNDSIDDSALIPSANPVRIQDEDEVRRWFEEGRTYAWMSEEYERRYNVTTTPSLWGNFRRSKWLARRPDRGHALIPWEVSEEHRWAYPLAVLRMEVRRRTGSKLTEGDMLRLHSWWDNLVEGDLVLAYDPETEAGFSYVPRRPGIDRDMIREPDPAPRRPEPPPNVP